MLLTNTVGPAQRTGLVATRRWLLTEIASAPAAFSSLTTWLMSVSWMMLGGAAPAGQPIGIGFLLSLSVTMTPGPAAAVSPARNLVWFRSLEQRLLLLGVGGGAVLV